MKIKFWLAGLFFSVSATTSSFAAKVSFDQYVENLKQEAVAKGFSSDFVNETLKDLNYLKRVVKADKNQPEFVETLDTYLPKRVPEWKVTKARNAYKENLPLLTKISEQYGVQPRFIVSLWALETNFGRIQGKMPIIDSLVTLSYDGRRETFFKNQLWASLTILQQGHISEDKFLGSWAGAMGQCQFIPTSFLAYAADGDGDGKKDIWNNKADVFASIANYLKSEGWSDNKTWGRQVKLPSGFDMSLIMPKGSKGRRQWLDNWKGAEKSLVNWRELGVTRMDGSALPSVDIDAVLITPDDAQGRIYLAYDNYKSLMHWNRSYYFVTSVGTLADRIGYPKIL
ncbi:MAG: membrane-bound lytic murein transglycosylase B [Psychrosphaera sp.]|jgi:membrane-bound lytic murein transglycosylase B|uniref:Lytic murein transglycosylase n=1 Tax=Psychrosphaera aquimarina TaxID=2044854 RepID=A0ABU3QZY3_9GAMM|nr:MULTISPECIES: lytic murein transglycosylase [Psychrosphaera]MBU2917167.1 lytic murein transglycosylase [Psychrosphaera sp. F3M07]MDU0113001.1 lytic murein transglycosylase [Psychrosphaera aquimarina]